MSGLHILALMLSIVVFIYLVVALLYPEKFQ